MAFGARPQASRSGHVVEHGQAAADWLGRAVLVPSLLPCGECEVCRRGRVIGCARLAARGSERDEVVPARWLLAVEAPLQPDLPLWRLAALADEIALPFAALLRLGVEPGAPLVVVGGRGLVARARAAVAIGVAQGAAVVFVDDDASARQAAETLGARLAVSAGEVTALPSRLAELSLPRDGWRIVETSGTTDGRALAAQVLPAGGTLALLTGAAPSSAPLPAAVLDGDAAVFGVSACHPDLYVELLAMTARGQIPVAELTEIVDAASAETARADYLAGRRVTIPVVAD
jgi:6-hydroxycyclohex-1-ene-1-carbonyl-CoA dehydrogenase